MLNQKKIILSYDNTTLSILVTKVSLCIIKCLYDLGSKAAIICHSTFILKDFLLSQGWCS